MKAIIINNNNALILDVLSCKRTGTFDVMTLKLSVNPVIEINSSPINTYVIESTDKDKEDDIALSVAETLVGVDGVITQYEPKENKKKKKYIKENK